jgi:hypothetical protein
MVSTSDDSDIQDVSLSSPMAKEATATKDDNEIDLDELQKKLTVTSDGHPATPNGMPEDSPPPPPPEPNDPTPQNTPKQNQGGGVKTSYIDPAVLLASQVAAGLREDPLEYVKSTSRASLGGVVALSADASERIQGLSTVAIGAVGSLRDDAYETVQKAKTSTIEGVQHYTASAVKGGRDLTAGASERAEALRKVAGERVVALRDGGVESLERLKVSR